MRTNVVTFEQCSARGGFGHTHQGEEIPQVFNGPLLGCGCGALVERRFVVIPVTVALQGEVNLGMNQVQLVQCGFFVFELLAYRHYNVLCQSNTNDVEHLRRTDEIDPVHNITEWYSPFENSLYRMAGYGFKKLFCSRFSNTFSHSFILYRLDFCNGDPFAICSGTCEVVAFAHPMWTLGQTLVVIECSD